MQTKPATAPEHAPRILALPRFIHSIPAQLTVPAAADRCVATKALAVSGVEASALPALKPNQPTHNSAAPMQVYVKLCGGIGSCPKPNRLPNKMAQTNAEKPLVICTTVPPAKSNARNVALAFSSAHQPASAHTQWATGQ